MAASEDKAKGIQAVEIAMRICDTLAAARQPMPLRQIAGASGVSPSNLRFYLVSLLRTGLVSQAPVGGHYGLGPAAIRLGLSALAQFDVVHAARGELHRIATELGFTTFLSVWGNGGAVAIDRVDGQVRTVLEIRVGTVFPLLTSAVGRCFVATLPEAEAQRAAWAESAAKSAANRRAVMDEVARIRTAFAEDEVTSAPGMVLADFTALAAPIRDSAGLPLATLSIVGPIGMLIDDARGAAAVLLREACDGLSHQLGWRAADMIGPD